MGRITRINIQGFRSLKDVEICDPGPISLLIGANGSGKSNLLAALKMVSLMVSGRLKLLVGQAGGASSLLHYGPAQTPVLSLRLELETDSGEPVAYDAQLGFAAGDSFVFLEERAGLRPQAHGEWQWHSVGSGHGESRLAEVAESNPTVETVLSCLRRLSYFHFHDTSETSALRTNSRREEDRDLSSNGSNLGAYLLSLRESENPGHVAAFRRIQGLVRQIAPFVRELSPRPINGGVARLDWIDDRGEIFGPQHFSDGTLRAIALFTALGQPVSRLPLFCTIDEPELGLHPAALDLFCELARSASAYCQAMLATQSTSLLDRFDASAVIVAERLDGSTHFRRLDADDLAVWLQEYQLSDLYESNVLGGRP